MALRPVQKDFPLEAATDLAHLVRSGALKANAALLAAACNDLISWASYEAFGDPTGPPRVGELAPQDEPGPPLTDEQVIAWLEAGGHYTAGGRLGAPMLPPRAILRFALKVLMSILL